jgi:tRNA 2-selenouridine synthase SelU
LRNSFQVEDGYKYLVPSKWHTTGWKYTHLPKVEKSTDCEKGEFLSTYSAAFQVPKLKNRQTSQVPRNSYSRPYTNWKLSTLRMSL